MSEHMQSDHRPRYTPGVLVTSGSSPLALMDSEALPGSPSRAPGTRAPPFLLHLDGLRLRPPALAAFPVRPGTLVDRAAHRDASQRLPARLLLGLHAPPRWPSRAQTAHNFHGRKVCCPGAVAAKNSPRLSSPPEEQLPFHDNVSLVSAPPFL